VTKKLWFQVGVGILLAMLIIKYFMDDASVGIYSLGHKLASVINVFILQSFQMGYLPIAYKKMNDEKDDIVAKVVLHAKSKDWDHSFDVNNADRRLLL